MQDWFLNLILHAEIFTQVEKRFVADGTVGVGKGRQTASYDET